ncbi:MAG: response regulator transcription factor [Rhodospirillaceae bacterium]|nr:response regulator transcription factor [Rhodospirillaceae bacterium]
MERETVYIVDDDAAVRDSIAQLLGMHGYETRQFADAAGYLGESERGPAAGCLLLDIRMPGMNGMELQDELRRRGRDEPIVFITGHGDIGLAVKAMKAGATDFLQKPCEEEELVHAVREALAGKRQAQPSGEVDEKAKSALSRLTEREREILSYVSKGLTSKTIAQRLGISVRTVDIHRANIMNKTDTRNVVELVRLALAGGFVPD